MFRYNVQCIKIRDSWDLTQCHWVHGPLRFDGSWHFGIQGPRRILDKLTLGNEGATVLRNIRKHAPDDRGSYPRDLNRQQFLFNNVTFTFNYFVSTSFPYEFLSVEV